MSNNLSVGEFINLFYMVREKLDPSVRLGQMFINLCIPDSSSVEMQALWNEQNTRTAQYQILNILADLQWETIPTTPDRLSTEGNKYFNYIVKALNAEQLSSKTRPQV